MNYELGRGKGNTVTGRKYVRKRRSFNGKAEAKASEDEGIVYSVNVTVSISCNQFFRNKYEQIPFQSVSLKPRSFNISADFLVIVGIPYLLSCMTIYSSRSIVDRTNLPLSESSPAILFIAVLVCI